MENHFYFYKLYVSNLLVAKLLYNSLCLSVSPYRCEVNMIFSAALEDRELNSLVKISFTYAHLLYVVFCPSICRGHASKDIHLTC